MNKEPMSMMEVSEKINLSKTEIDRDYARCGSLREVIEQIEAEHWSRGRVVCELRVNGLYFTEDDEEKFASIDLSEIKDIEILVRNPQDLFKESILSVKEMLPKLKDEVVRTAELLREGGDHQSYSQMVGIFDCTKWISEALILSKRLVIDWVGNDDFSQRWDVVESEFNKALASLLGAYQHQDTVLLSDILEYDFSVALDKWLELLNSEDKIQS